MTKAARTLEILDLYIEKHISDHTESVQDETNDERIRIIAYSMRDQLMQVQRLLNYLKRQRKQEMSLAKCY